jgi:hypothetical protein
VDCKTENWVWLCKCANFASANTFFILSQFIPEIPVPPLVGNLI